MSGPIRSYSGPRSSGGTLGRQGAITIAAITTGASADYTIADVDAQIGDVISVSLANADMEASLGVIGAWVSAEGTISVRILNSGAGTLTGGAAVVYYTITR